MLFLNVMKKSYKILVAAIAIVICTMTLSSCDSYSAAGFREGWNATAPAEYRY